MLKELESIASKLNEAYAQLNRVLDSITEEQATQILVTPEWSVKDEVAHLAGATRGMFGIAQRSSKGENPKLPEGYNNDTFNARQVAKRKEQTLAQIRAELGATVTELQTFLNGVTPEQLDLQGQHPIFGETKLKDLLVIIYNHETQHCIEIAAAMRAAKK